MNFTDVRRVDISSPQEYFAIDAVSNSDLTLLAESPSQYKDTKDGLIEREEKSGYHLGSVFDSLVLTPDAFYEDYAIVPADIETPTTDMQTLYFRFLGEGVSEKEAARLAGYTRAPKAGLFDRLLEFRAENEGKIALSWADAGNIERMQKNIMAHPLIPKILEESEKQVVFTATHEETGLAVKCMIDLLWERQPDSFVTVDVKSTITTDRRAFRSHFFRYAYDRQASYYSEISGAETAAIIAVSKLSNWHQAMPLYDYLDEGALKASALLEAMAWHKETDSWGYSYECVHADGWEAL